MTDESDPVAAPPGDRDRTAGDSGASRSGPPPAPEAAADPEVCPVCDVAYDSVSVHDAGLLVNLLDNERYRRVCFEPVAAADGTSLIRFYHHTHDQAALDG
ncbi:hypothetical protein [Halococcus agarilyticus]|uniref:hypothetical protein n=1 Tax=Halococcus agarilyticus TaxID=1232219 RepID=UPI0006782612|nr:hypothetical protein [Halococcus agarilyticus]